MEPNAAATLFLVVGLALSGFVWFLAAQMRFFVMRVLELNADDMFPEADAAMQKDAARAAAMGVSDPMGDAIAERCGQAIGHYRLARKVRFVAPVAALLVVVIWRFVLGGGS